eukprot:12108642-Alexandrium_andersonii.AAC.1
MPVRICHHGLTRSRRLILDPTQKLHAHGRATQVRYAIDALRTQLVGLQQAVQVGQARVRAGVESALGTWRGISKRKGEGWQPCPCLRGGWSKLPLPTSVEQHAHALEG